MVDNFDQYFDSQVLALKCFMNIYNACIYDSSHKWNIYVDNILTNLLNNMKNIQKLLYDTTLQNKPHHNLIDWEK
jgi:hypothetical protein